MDEPNTEPVTEAKPVRDVKTGRFVKGHKSLRRVGPATPAQYISAEERLSIKEKKQAMHGAITAEMVADGCIDLYVTAKKTKDPKAKKDIYEFLFNELGLKPQKEVTEISHKIQTKTEIDLTKLTQEELDTWETLAGKTQTVEGSTTLYLGENVTRG